MKRLHLLTFFVICFSHISCVQYKHFTTDLRQEYGWNEEDLKKIQFYVSEDIILEKRQSGGSSQIENGKIIAIEGKVVDKIVIPAKTPGVLLFMPKENRMAVTFESEGDENFLVFGPNPNYGDRYCLLAADWKRNSGLITYNGTTYATSKKSAFASLMVDLKEIKKYEENRQVAKGRKVK